MDKMKKELKTLEYDKILDILKGYAVSDCGKEAVLEIRPAGYINGAEESLKRTSEAYAALSKHNLNPVSSFDDCAAILHKAALNSVLSCGELLKAARLLRTSRLFKAAVEGLKEESLPYLNGLAAGVSVFRDIEGLIFENVSEDNEISDRASNALRGVRVKIKNCNRDIKDKLNNYIKSPSYAKYLQDNIITVRSGRFCLSVKSECRGQIQGLVHDQSSSGATLFIEPMQIVELNNQLKILYSEEAAEIERILREYTAGIGQQAAAIKINQAVLTEADVLFAKAQYAAAAKASKPKLNGCGTVSFKKARHPLIDASKIVPIDIALGKEFSILIITGPNTGGKTVTLKTTGLLCLMAASGMYIPAEEDAEAAVFKGVFCDIGDEQSIAQDLSTFSSHIKNIVNITENVCADSLVLLDELGAGTDPHEGAALAAGIIDYLCGMGAKAVITTHYSELKGLAERNPRVQNASMQFDTETLMPTYRLKIGMAGASCAMQVARYLGLKEEILEYAYSSADKLKMSYDAALTRAQKAILEIDGERDEVGRLKVRLEEEYLLIAEERQNLRAARERLKENAKAEVKRLCAEALGKAESIIAGMKEILAKPAPEEKDLFELNRLKNQIKDIAAEEAAETEHEKISPMPADEIKPGITVVVISLKSRASVISVNVKKAEAEVKMGVITVIVPFSDLGNPV